ncbi:PAS domain S-box protein [Methanospirillum stamsii]|uniref:histidine kinase n=1 Tax=Methanospirillum stamsii TaxID=1277351 RepID=A0A2V2NEK9_9EURY|nr:PAS domain S-box protein [Methanospirillum stamsii]PWR76016.1 hypothetical protein DLD82_01610 [Methanospirillum stamsii]
MIRVLFIESNQEIFEVDRTFFNNLPGYEPEFETDGIKAIERIIDESFDAIITDCEISGIDIITLITKIRQRDPDIPIGIFSGTNQKDLIIQAINEGADFFVWKESKEKNGLEELFFRIRHATEKYQKLKTERQDLERYRELTDESPDMILQLDVNQCIHYANKTFAKNTGNEPISIIGKNFRELQDSPVNTRIWEKQVGKVLKTGKPSRLEYQRADGKWYDRILVPGFDKDNNIQVLTIASREITEKKKIEKDKENFLQELVRQKRFTDALLDAIPIPVHWKNNVKQYAGCNKAFVDLTGIPSKKLIGRTYFEIWSDKEAEICHYYDQKLINDGYLSPYQSVLIDTAGKAHEIIHSKNLFYDHQGEIAGIVGSFQDMTEQNQLLHDLKNNEELFRMIITQSSDIFIIITKSLEISYISPRIEPTSGFLCEEILGPVKRFLHPEDYDPVLTKIIRLIENPSFIEEAEFRTRKRDGTFMNLEATAINCLENPAIQGILVTARDITSHKKIEKQLTRINTLFQSILDYSPVIFALLNDNGTVLLTNETFVENNIIFGSDSVGKPIWNFLPPQLRAECEKILDNIRILKKSIFREFTFQLEDKEVSLSTIFYPVQDEEEELIGFLGIDITEKRELVTRLDKSLFQQELLDHIVKERTEEITFLLELKNNLITGIAHELRTPLTPIIALIPVLINDEEDEKNKRLLEIVRDNAMQITSIVDKILQLARSGSMYEIVDTSPINVNVFISRILDIYELAAARKNITITKKIPPSLTFITSPPHIESVMDNIISNAIKYSNPFGNIRITAVENDDSIEISVCDDGIGIKEENLIRIFEPFYKADTSRHDRSSPGLGLSVTRRLVQALGGNITISSKGLGMGTRVNCIFKKRVS